jgi:hypothetical protein
MYIFPYVLLLSLDPSVPYFYDCPLQSYFPPSLLHHSPSTVTQAVTFLTRVLKVLVSHLFRDGEILINVFVFVYSISRQKP